MITTSSTVPIEDELVIKAVLINMTHCIALMCGTSTYPDATHGVSLQSSVSINDLSTETA